MDEMECLICRRRFKLDVHFPFCPGCGEPGNIARPARPRAFHPEKKNSLEKSLDFLPLETFSHGLDLGEGSTPLLPLERLGKKLRLPRLWAKNEALNPTGSFKDRGSAIAVRKAVELGFRRIGTVSTGNMAASTAAYGARAGLETVVLLKEGTSLASLLAAGVYGPLLFCVQGDYGRLFYDSLAIGRKLGVYFMNSIDPFRLEGYKVTGYEISWQLGEEVPGYIFVPLSSGGHLAGLIRAFEDLEAEGLVKEYPVFVGVQAEGCAPLARAFAAGSLRYQRLDRAQTIAHAISNPAPPAGNLVLKMIRDRNGLILAVSDAEMLEAQKILAREEGLFVQPESAAALAGLLKFVREKLLPPKKNAVLVLTGSGLKAMKALEALPLRVTNLPLAGLEAGLRGVLSSGDLC